MNHPRAALMPAVAVIALAAMLGGCMTTPDGAPTVARSCTATASCGELVEALGLRAERVDGKGVTVVEVIEGGPAAERRIKAGDRIIEASLREIASVADLKDAIGARQGNDRSSVLLLIERKGDMSFVAVRLGAQGKPPSAVAKGGGDDAKQVRVRGSAAAREAVDRELFTGNPFVSGKVYKFPGEMVVAYLPADDLPAAEFERVAPIIASVDTTYANVLPTGTKRLAGNGDLVKFVMFFVDKPCDAACRDRYTEHFRSRAAMGFEMESEEGTLCFGRAPIDEQAGEIKGGVGVIDVTLPEHMFTYCMLRVFNSMIANTNLEDSITFPARYEIEGKKPAEIIRAYMLRPAKVGSLRFLYDPSIKPGMSREEFWTAVDRMP